MVRTETKDRQERKLQNKDNTVIFFRNGNNPKKIATMLKNLLRILDIYEHYFRLILSKMIEFKMNSGYFTTFFDFEFLFFLCYLMCRHSPFSLQ